MQHLTMPTARAKRSATFCRGVYATRATLADYLVCEFGDDDGALRLADFPRTVTGLTPVAFFRTKRDADAFVSRIREMVSAKRGVAGDHDCFAE